MDAERPTPDHGRAVTVVTITRNNLDGLRRTLASVKNQDFRDVQHVIIDGASTDGTVAWLRDAATLDDTVIVSEPDRGVYDAMNKGGRLATGRLLNFLNAGDVFAHAAVLSRVVESQARLDWTWGFGLARVVYPDGRPRRPVRSIRYSLRRHALGQIAVSHQATFMRTSLFRELGGYDDRFPLAGDTDLLLRAGLNARPFQWDSVDVLYESGGMSEQRVIESTFERHAVRAARGVAIRPLALDFVWTAGQVAVIAARKAAKQLLNAASRGRFTKWWAARGL